MHINMKDLKQLGMSQLGIHSALKSLKVTYKKIPKTQKANEEERREFKNKIVAYRRKR